MLMSRLLDYCLLTSLNFISYIKTGITNQKCIHSLYTPFKYMTELTKTY